MSPAILRPALAYWGAIFALGFVLGTLRVLVLVPLLGELAAVLLEAPVILTASWLWARHLVRRHTLRPGAALAMGLLAFTLLMGCEAVLATAAFGQSAAEWLAGMGEPAGAIGLAGQVVFALLPWWAAKSAERA